MKNKIHILLILSLFALPMMAEKAQWERNITATGNWDIVGNISFNEAKECALFEAQKAALRQAGVGTSVKSASFSAMSSSDENYSDELFNQINSFYISGRVRLCEEPVYAQDIVNGIIRITVTIKADVLKDQPSDPTFRLAVNGFNRMYREGENITFTVKSSKDCYIRIFWFDDTVTGQGSLLFPYEGFDNDEQLKAGTTYSFPLSKSLDYTTTMVSDKEQEMSFIFIVATEKKIPYMEQTTSFKQFFQWYYAIDSEERTEYYPYGFTIIKQ